MFCEVRHGVEKRVYSSRTGSMFRKLNDNEYIMRKKFHLLVFCITTSFSLGCSGGEQSGVPYSRSISGRLKDNRGNPIVQALITLEDAGGDSQNSALDTVTNRDGEFTFRTSLVGPDLNFLIAEKGSPEVTVSTVIREGQDSKLGLVIAKSGTAVDLQQSVDVTLIPSSNCEELFSLGSDIKQIGFTDERCQIATSAIVVGSRTDNISITAIAEKCPIEISCPRDESSIVERGLTIDLVTGVNQDICDYRIEYRNRNDELLQTLRIRSGGDRLTKCR